MKTIFPTAILWLLAASVLAAETNAVKNSRTGPFILGAEISWAPEDEADGEIDAIIDSFAVQHTSVDSVSAGREADAQFKKVIRELEHDLAGTLGYALTITWDWAAVRKGQNWAATHDALRSWIVSGEPRKFADGRHSDVEVPGVPFTLDIHRRGLDWFDGVRFARYDPKDGTLGPRLMDQLTGRHEKLPVLARYRADGKTTVLLLESRDIALMDPVLMVQALETAFPAPPPDLDQIWFMHYRAPGTVNVHDLRSGEIWLFDLKKHVIELHNPYGPSLHWPAK
jgi:hypothetical protein